MNIDPGLKEELKQYLLQKISDKKQTIVLVSAYPLEKHEVDSIVRRFESLEHARVENEVDKSILAGFIIRFGTKLIDVSLKRKLEDVDASMTKVL